MVIGSKLLFARIQMSIAIRTILPISTICLAFFRWRTYLGDDKSNATNTFYYVRTILLLFCCAIVVSGCRVSSAHCSSVLRNIVVYCTSVQCTVHMHFIQSLLPLLLMLLLYLFNKRNASALACCQMSCSDFHAIFFSVRLVPISICWWICLAEITVSVLCTYEMANFRCCWNILL